MKVGLKYVNNYSNDVLVTKSITVPDDSHSCVNNFKDTIRIKREPKF